MKHLLTLAFCGIFWSSANAQQTLKLSIQGVNSSVASQLSQNSDRLSWYTDAGSAALVTNVEVEIHNPEQKSGDRARAAVKADRNAQGQYDFKVDVEVNIRRVDLAKPIEYEVVMPTVLGNEVFARGTQAEADFSKPIVLDKYMWRSSNDKIQPEKKLCLAFAAFIENADLRSKYAEKEGPLKFERNDFELFLKQEAAATWRKFEEPLQGTLNNGNALALTSTLPSWINTNLPLQVRFAVKTPLGNSIWGEYTVNPHEYRKEHRAQFYTAEAFNPNSAPKLGQSPAEPSSAPSNTPVKTEQAAPTKGNVAVQSKPEVKASQYNELIAQADQLFKEGKFKEAGEKYAAASAIQPAEEYPKKQKEMCDSKLAPPARPGANPPKRPGAK